MSFAGEAWLAGARDVAGEGVLSVTAVTPDAFDLVVVSEEVLSTNRDEDPPREHVDRVLAGG